MRDRIVALSCLTAALWTCHALGDGQGAEPEPILKYTFDSGLAGVAVNVGTLGAAGNGTISGAILSNDTHTGSGMSLDFNGVDNYIALANNFTYGSALTVEFWIKPDVVTQQRVLWDDYGNPGVLMTVKTGQLQWNVSTAQHPAGGAGTVAGVITPGAWQHVAGTYDGSAIRSFVNGVEIGCMATAGTVVENAHAPKIGSDNLTTTALNYDGKLDDFRLWKLVRAVADLSNGEFAGAGRSPDISGDGIVNGSDLGQMLGAWGACADVCCSADLTRDGVVDGADLGLLLSAWGG